MSNEISGESFENLSYEDRTFTPSQSFIDNANAKSDTYDLANKDRLAFWEKQAERLTWDKKWSQVVDWQLPFAKWFVGGKLNASYNCLDRHDPFEKYLNEVYKISYIHCYNHTQRRILG
mgnify:CR=1 FL=1